MTVMSPRQQIDEERNDRMAAHLDHAILALRHHASPWIFGRYSAAGLGDHFPFPAAYWLLCLMMPVLAALGADFAAGNNFFRSTISLT
jgi:hypothetical protein